jgi:hypothetical protein
MVESFDVLYVHYKELTHNRKLRIISTNLIQTDLALQNEIQQVDHFEAAHSQLYRLYVLQGNHTDLLTIAVDIDITAKLLDVLRIVIDNVGSDPRL